LSLQNLTVSKEGNIGIISINRPEVLNVLNFNTLEELDEVLNELGNDSDVYVIILTGSGKSFAAGADIESMVEMNPDDAHKFASYGASIYRKIECFEKPVIAAVNGYALGGGFELALACDIIVASEKAKFGLPEVGLGIMPGFSGSVRLPELIGSKRAKELIFTGKIITAEEAGKIGLVNVVTNPDNTLDHAIDIAKQISMKGQIGVRYSKKSINHSFDMDMNSAIAMEASLFSLCFASPDQKEGMVAFLNKRKPNFTNGNITSKEGKV
jgi:enoyl-CoA hydratase